MLLRLIVKDGIIGPICVKSIKSPDIVRMFRIPLNKLFAGYVNHLIYSIDRFGIVVSVFVELTLALRIVDQRGNSIIWR